MRDAADLDLDLGQHCELVTRQPDRRTGPLLLRFALRCVVQHRPLAQEVEICLLDGRTLSEGEIEAIYAAILLAGPLSSEHGVSAPPGSAAIALGATPSAASRQDP